MASKNLFPSGQGLAAFTDKPRLRPPYDLFNTICQAKTPYLEKSEIFLLYVVVIQGCIKNAFLETIAYLSSPFQHFMTHPAAGDGNHSCAALVSLGRKKEGSLLKNRDPASAVI